MAVTDGNGAYQPVVFEFRDNGRYSFKVYDALGNTQEVSVEITGIDKAAPVITGVTITYSLADGQKETIKHTPGPEAGWVFANDKYATTNQNVTVTVTTDKDTVLKGEADSDTITDEDYDTENSKEYSANGLFNFNLQAKNGIISNYGVDIELIDKTPPTIAFDGSQELVFIEDMTAGQDESLTYSSKKLLDYHAFDVYKGVETDLTEQVTIDYGTFNKDDITKNTFDRNKPYTIIYRVADSAGNVTEIRRTVRLVGKYDTILLINDKMPSSDGTADAEGGTFTMKLKNFSGTAYARVAQGWYTMGQMKTEGTMLSAKNGVYTLSNLTQGWYTVFVQTDKRDYFTYWIFVNGTK